MSAPDADALLALLRDPNRETQEIAAAAGVAREDAGRAARLVLGIAKAKAEDVLTLPAPLALAVLRAAGSSGRGDVLAAAAGHASKDVAKEAKRALWSLRARGVAVPEPQRVPAVAPAPPPEPPLPSYASAVDGHGERAVWLARNVPGKGVEVSQAVVSDVKGLTELHVGVLGRKEYRTFARDILERGRSMGVTEIDRETAKSILAAARQLNDAAGAPPPEGADAWLARAGPAAPLPDPADRFPPLPDDEERAAVESSARLHELPLVRGWLADEDALRALAQKLDEIGVSALYVDERQRAEAATRAIADATAACLEAPARARWAARLFTVAAHLEGAGDVEHARIAAATARALRSGGDPARIPFARLLVEKAFPPPAAVAEAPPAPTGESPLIVPPAR